MGWGRASASHLRVLHVVCGPVDGGEVASEGRTEWEEGSSRAKDGDAQLLKGGRRKMSWQRVPEQRDRLTRARTAVRGAMWASRRREPEASAS